MATPSEYGLVTDVLADPSQIIDGASEYGLIVDTLANPSGIDDTPGEYGLVVDTLDDPDDTGLRVWTGTTLTTATVHVWDGTALV